MATERASVHALARSGMWSAVAYGATAGSVFAISVVLGRALGPADFGRYSFFVWVVRTVPALLALGVPTAIAKTVAEDEALARPVMALARRLHLLLLPVPVGVTAVLAATGRLSAVLALVVAGGVAVTLYSLDYEALGTGLRQFRLLAAFAALGSAGQVAVSLLGLALGFSWEGFLLAFVVVATVSLAGLAVACRRLVGQGPGAPLDPAERDRFVRFAGVSAFTLVVDQLLWGRPELAFLGVFHGDADVGHYAAALRLASLAAVIPVVVSKPLLPEFSRLRGAGDHDGLVVLFPRVCRLLALLAAPLAVIGAALAGPAVRVVYGPEFEGAVTATAILLAGSMVAALSSALLPALLTGPRPRFVLQLGGAAVVVNLALDLALVPPFGRVGAAVANVAAQAAWVAGATVWARRRLGLPYPFAALARSLVLVAPAAVVAGTLARAVPSTLGVLAAGLAGLAAYALAVAATER